MEHNALFYEYYDVLYAEKDYQSEIRHIMAMAKKSPPGRILEVGSGTGNHSLCCARLGFNVVGVDIDEQMVAVAMAKLRHQPMDISRRVSFIHGPVEDLDMSGFDMGICLFNVINYMDHITHLRCFMQGVHDRLERDAPFLFDAWNGVAALRDPPRLEKRHIRNDDVEITMTVRPETDFMRMRAELIYTLEVTNNATGSMQKAEYSLMQTLWPPKVISDVVASAGFHVKAVMALTDADRQATEKDWKVLFFCRKE
jgi:SAM-dependent methyltransferase